MSRTAASLAAAGLVVAMLGLAGCSSGQPGTPSASVESCIQFGVSAIRQHVTVTALPPACRGLTAAQVDSAVGAALRSAGSGVQGKAQRRARIAQASHYLAHLYVTAPAPRSAPVSAPAAHWVSRTTLGLAALGAWLVTVALGLWMMARQALRGRARRGPAGRPERPPALSLAHLGLAGLSLLAWVAYLASAETGLAWAAAGLLPLVAGLGMALLFLSPLGGRRMPALAVAAHVIFATATILFAVLAAIGTG